jgi:hypothetical protein
MSEPVAASDPGATSDGVPSPVAMFESVALAVASSARHASRRASVAISAPSSRNPVRGPVARPLVLAASVINEPTIDA